MTPPAFRHVDHDRTIVFGEGAVAAWAVAAREVLAELPVEVVCALMVTGAAVSGGC